MVRAFLESLCKDINKNSPVLTSLNETLFCVLRASFKLGCTKSLSAPPLDEAILVAALVLNPRHPNTLLFAFAGSVNEKRENIFLELLEEEQRASKGHQHENKRMLVAFSVKHTTRRVKLISACYNNQAKTRKSIVDSKNARHSP